MAHVASIALAFGVLAGLAASSPAEASEVVACRDGYVSRPAADQDTKISLGRSFWRHNGSAVYLYTDGRAHKFYYQRPRLGLKEIVKPNTLLIDAVAEGDRISGIAYLFSKKCGPASYAVQGAGDDRRIELRGQAPVRNSACKEKGRRNDVLTFDLVSRTEADRGTVTASSPFAIAPKAAILKVPEGTIDRVANLEEPTNSEIANSLPWSLIHGMGIEPCFYDGNDDNQSDNQFLEYFFEIARYYSKMAAELRVLGYPARMWTVAFFQEVGQIRLRYLARKSDPPETKPLQAFHGPLACRGHQSSL